MSIRSRPSILRLNLGQRLFTNTVLVRRMVKISLGGVLVIRSMQHGGTLLLKVRKRKFIFFFGCVEFL